MRLRLRELGEKYESDPAAEERSRRITEIEVILKEYFYDLIVVSYKRLQHFVSIWRGHDPEAFVYFEWLYNRWTNDEAQRSSN